MRKLASIKLVAEKKPIEGADLIEAVRVDGWWVVSKKGELEVGHPVMYFEIDSWIPTEIAPFLSKGKEPREYNGVKGEKLKTIKLRGQVSQGLILPLFPRRADDGRYVASDILMKISTYENVENRPYPVFVENVTEEGFYIELDASRIDSGLFDIDFTEALGVQKWEPYIPAQLQGQMKGNFPSFGRKTDQERIENLLKEVFQIHKDSRFEVTLKLDGSSHSAYFNNGVVGVCSRNLELKLDDENKDNSYIKIARESGLLDALEKFGKNIMVSSEMMGPGIQGNREKLSTVELFVFDIFDIDKQEYMVPSERMKVFSKLQEFGFTGNHVPVLHESVTIGDLGIIDIASAKKFAEKPSMNSKIAEGFVFKQVNGEFSFKDINNEFLIKTES